MPSGDRRNETMMLSRLVPILLLALVINPALRAQSQDEDIPVFRGGVNLVNIFFNVKDKRGALIPGLTKDDFQVLEDGKPQNIKYFSAESNQPLTLGILIDTSPSMQNVLAAEKEVGSAFLSEVLREKDLAFVISFDVNVDLLQDFTNSHRDLRAGLQSARINAGGIGGTTPGLGGGPIPPSAQPPRGTLLFDAIYLAADEKLGREVGRKAIIVLTDGVDWGSKLELRDAIEAAHKADAMVYVLHIADYSRDEVRATGSGDMRKLANETGGRMIDGGDDSEDLKKAFDQIASELRNQYAIGYTPANVNMDGSFRKIQIKPLKKDLKIQSRNGYYAVKQD